MFIARLAASVLLLMPLGEASAQDTAVTDTVAIRAGTVIHPETGVVARDQVILIEGEQIRAVGTNVAIPANATVIDLAESTVLPGLMDCETHLNVSVVSRPDIPRPQQRGSTGAAFYTTVVETTAYRAIQGVVFAKEMLDTGFTTGRDCGHAGLYADSALRRAIEEGLVPGPTMVNAGRMMAPFGGQFQLQPEHPDILQPEYIFADTETEMIKGVRENIHYGAKVIKIVVDDQKYIYSPEEIRIIVDEAARAGVKVVAHCKSEEAIRNAALGGVASILHAQGASDEALQLMKEEGVVLVGTDFPLLMLKTMGRSEPETLYARSVDRLRRAYAIGTEVAFGTDVSWPVTGYTRGELAIMYIEPFLDAGISPLDLLRAMTSDAARLIGVDQERGAIAPGLAADLIATPRNPLEDPQTLKEVHFVMKNGRVIRHNP